MYKTILILICIFILICIYLSHNINTLEIAQYIESIFKVLLIIPVIFYKNNYKNKYFIKIFHYIYEQRGCAQGTSSYDIISELIVVWLCLGN